MRAIILCAGYGTRLGTLTKDRPKPMIEIAGRPVIEHILTRLSIHGINDIIVNLHYLSGIIPEYLGNRVLYYYEPRLLGHEGTIRALHNWLSSEESFFVVNGDTISDVDYTAMIQFHQKGTITSYMDEWRSAGTWIYSREYFINKDISVRPYRQRNSIWYDIGTPERLEEARKYYDNQKSRDLSHV